jgi:hypothetical protein
VVPRNGDRHAGGHGRALVEDAGVRGSFRAAVTVFLELAVAERHSGVAAGAGALMGAAGETEKKRE